MLRTRERVQRKEAAAISAGSVSALADNRADATTDPAPLSTPAGAGHSLVQYNIISSPQDASPAVTVSDVPAPITTPIATDAFNPESIVHDLRRAIDQSAATVDWSNPRVYRKIDAALVMQVLDNLTAKQAKAVIDLYEAEEKRPGCLVVDLFGGGTSDVPGSLTSDQEARIRAQLRGTKAEETNAATTGARIEADVVEIHELLSDSLKDAKLDRMMALHRRPVDEIGRIDGYYKTFYGTSLPEKSQDTLKGLQLVRLNALRAGDWTKADAAAIEDKRQAIAKLDAQMPLPWDMEENADRRKALVGGIESIIEQNKQEAIADPNNAGKTQAQATAERVTAILGEHADGDEKSVGEGLADTLKSKAGAIIAMANGSLVEAAARRLLEMEESNTTKTDRIAPLLKGFRTQAEHDVMAAMYSDDLGPGEKQAIASNPPLLRSAIDALAKRYTDSFVEVYDNIRGEHRSWTEIVASADDYNQVLLNELKKGGGHIEDQAVELDIAIRKKDVDGIKAILARQPNKDAVSDLTARYNATHDVDLRTALFGGLGEEAAATVDAKFTGALLSGRSAAAAQESLAKPSQYGTGEEVEWIAEHGRRERTVTEANSGAMGALRSIGDDPETQVLMSESAARLTELEAEWKSDTPHGRPKPVILAEMRRVRATLTGDATAYEEDNARMVAELRSAISFAVQIALAVALPGFPSNLLATMALNIGANVASNMVIRGDEYTLTSLRNDVLGGLLGGVGGKFGEEIAGAIASQVTGTAARATVEAAEKAGLTVALAKESGQAASMASEATLTVKAITEAGNLAGGAAGTTIATGENRFTAEGLAMGFFMNRVGGLRGELKAPGPGVEALHAALGETQLPMSSVEQSVVPHAGTEHVATDITPLPAGLPAGGGAAGDGGTGGGGVPGGGGASSGGGYIVRQRPTEPGAMVIHELIRPGDSLGQFDVDATVAALDPHSPSDVRVTADTYFDLPAGRDVTPGQLPGHGLQSIDTRINPNPNQIAYHESMTFEGVTDARLADHDTISMDKRGAQMGQPAKPAESGNPETPRVPHTMGSVLPDDPARVITSPVPPHGHGSPREGQPRPIEVRTHSSNPAAGLAANAPDAHSRFNPTTQINTNNGRYLLPDGRWVGQNSPDIGPAHYPVGGRDRGPDGLGDVPDTWRRPDPESPEVQQQLHSSLDATERAIDTLGEAESRSSDYHVFEVHTSPPGGKAAAAPEPITAEVVSPDRLRDTYGMPVANQAKFQQIAEKYGVEIDVRPTVKEAPALLAQGAVAKPEDLKSKTINDLDVHLGARREDIGKVGFFKPEPPQRPAGMDDTTWSHVVARFSQRDAEYWDNAKRMTELQRRTENQQEKSGPMDERGTHQEHQIVIGDDGVVRAVVGDDASFSEPPFTGDHDVFDIRRADPKAPKLTDEEYNAIVDEMKAARMGVEHGAHMRWDPKTPAEQAIFDAIVTKHTSGAEVLIRFGPNQPPTTAAPK